MKLVLFNQGEDEFLSDVVDLGEEKISTVNGLFYLTAAEKREIIEYSKTAYQKVLERSDTDNFFGHIRVDLVPEISNFRHIENGYEWDLSIKGIYEINSNAPECGAATAALHANHSKLAKFQPDPAKRIIKSLNGHINGEKVAFVIGRGAVKKEWGYFFMKSLRDKGLNVKKATPEEAVDYDCVWRFGDIRDGSYSEFPDYFRNKLIKKQKDSLVLNTVPESPEKDIGNKRFLLNYPEEQELRDREDALWAIRQSDRVLKPLRGTSGKGIYFQENFSDSQWRKKLLESIGKGYGLYKAKWLPKLNIEEVENGIVMDVSPSFLAKGRELDYLYSISRIEEHGTYKKRKTINVAKGGGFVGTLVDN